MNKIIEKIMSFKYGIVVMFLILAVLGFGFQQKVEVNNNMLDYLPSEVEGVEGKEILDEVFSVDNKGSFYMVLTETNELGVMEIVMDLSELSEISVVTIKDENNNDYLLDIVLSSEYSDFEDFNEKVSEILDEHNVSGGVFSNTTLIPISNDSLGMIIMLFVALAILIVLFTKSYFDVVIILTSLIVAILINMGSNIIFGEISSVTARAAVLIQLAVSIDYTLFILSNYKLRREQGVPVDKAISNAVKMSVKPVLAGAITTIAGFVALMFMKLEIGLDLGLVLSKGIFISLITALFLVPVLIKIFNNPIDKMTHKPLLPTFKSFGKITGKKVSVLATIVFIVFVVFGSIGKSKVDYIYRETSVNEYEQYADENFSLDNTVVMIVDIKDGVDTNQFIKEVYAESDLHDVVVINKDVMLEQTVNTTADVILQCIGQGSFDSSFCIPYESYDSLINSGVDKATLMNLIQNNDAVMSSISTRVNEMFVNESNGVTYEMVIIKLYDPNNQKISDDIFMQIETLRGIASNEFGDDVWITSNNVLTYDLKLVNEIDYPIVTMISIIAVGLVIFISFKSVLVPLILLTLIQGAIWINLASSYLVDEQLIFMGAIIVGAIQLGASIDYSILLAEKYEHNRFDGRLRKKEAITKAVEESSHSIITSGLALTIGGYIMFFTQTGTVQQMGLLLGRGAFISLLISMIVAPHFLYVFDRLLEKEHNLKTDISRKS